MPDTQTIDEAVQIFGKVARPEHFTDFTHCSECAEHDSTLRPFSAASGFAQSRSKKS